MATDANMMAGPHAQCKTTWPILIAKDVDQNRARVWLFAIRSLMMMMGQIAC
jgi:hypothetical protein